MYSDSPKKTQLANSRNGSRTPLNLVHFILHMFPSLLINLPVLDHCKSPPPQAMQCGSVDEQA